MSHPMDEFAMLKPAAVSPDDRRREPRVQAVVPVRLSTAAATGMPVSTAACTLEVSLRGARLRGTTLALQLNEIVTLTLNEREAHFRVVWAEPGSARSRQLGLACLEPEIGLWCGLGLLDETAGDRETMAAPGGTGDERRSGYQAGQRRAPRFVAPDDLQRQLAAASALRLPTQNGKRSLLLHPAAGSEKFGVLAARLNIAQAEHQIKSVVVTSSLPQEGKSFTAVNLALGLAQQARKRVLLLEGNLRTPSLCATFGMTAPAGLGQWWATHDQPITSFLYRVEPFSLWFLPAGQADNPAEMLESPRLAELSRQMASWFDWIVIDAPAVLPVADANLWVRIADSTLLVVSEGRTPRKSLEEALDALDDPKIVGVVLNDTAEREMRYSTPRDGHVRRDSPSHRPAETSAPEAENPAA